MNRLEWILGIFLVVLLVVVLGLAIMLWTQPSSPVAVPQNGAPGGQAALVAPTPVFEGETAKASFSLAQAQAQTWQSDVTLLSANATWPQGTQVQDLLTGTSTWAFTFYSPGQNAVRQVTVVEDRVTLLAERAYQPAQPLPAMSGWQVDSHTAVQQFLAEGGHDFMRQEGITTVTMSLRTDDPDGRITWLISAFAAQTNHSFTMNIDANSGGIIDIDHIQ
jgi:hypothetical protein